MENKPFTISDTISEGWRLTKENLGFLLCYQAIMLIFMALFAGGDSTRAWWPIHFLGFCVNLVMKMGFFNSALLIVDGIKPSYDQLFTNWRLFFTWLITEILYGLMLAFGLLLLIIPGLYVLSRLGLYPFVIFDKKLGAIDTLKETAKLTKDHVWDLFLLFMACLGLNILGTLLLGIGLFLTIPTSLLAITLAYRSLAANRRVAIEQTP